MRWRKVLPVVAVLLLAEVPAQAFLWPNAIERVTRDLKDEDVATRRGAAQRLVELPPQVARDLVLRALEDPDDEVKLAAAQAAIQFRLVPAALQVLPWLNAAERRLRLAAAEVLREVPDRRAVGPLGRVLGDQDATVRQAAATALGETGDPAASRALLGYLDDSVPQVREAVVGALAQLGDPSAVVPLIGKVQDPRVSVRARVVAALGDLGDPQASSALVLALEDTEPEVVAAALEALGKLRSTRATSAIIATLEGHDSPMVRQASVEALARIQSPQCIEALVGALRGGHRGVPAEVVVDALARVGAKARAPLEACLAGHPAAMLASGCARTLGKLGGDRAASVITNALNRDVVSPVVALESLQTLARHETLPVVLEYLGDSDSTVRQAAERAALVLLDPRRPDGRAVEPIHRALMDRGRQPTEQAVLALLLGRTGSARAVPLLAPLAADCDDPDLRLAAIRALGMIAPAGQDGVLLRALEDDSPSLRWEAAVALRQVASARSTAELLDRLERRPAQDRVALAVALAGALARTETPSLVERAVKDALAAQGGERDALIEAVGFAFQPVALGMLTRLAQHSAAAADRAKAAEALGSHPEGADALRVLVRDPDGAVRANAVWSLGKVGSAADVDRLEGALRDPDVTVVGNAVAALGRLAVRGATIPVGVLCGLLEDHRAYVRANALGALGVTGHRCPRHPERDLLLHDSSPITRQAAAQLLQRVPSADPAADVAVLDQCVHRERDGQVAAACASRPPPISSELDAVTVYVVPAGETSPVPRAPFALVLPDALIRLGVTDRRGVVYETSVPRGTVSLAVPAPLAW